MYNPQHRGCGAFKNTTSQERSPRAARDLSASPARTGAVDQTAHASTAPQQEIIDQRITSSLSKLFSGAAVYGRARDKSRRIYSVGVSRIATLIRIPAMYGQRKTLPARLWGRVVIESHKHRNGGCYTKESSAWGTRSATSVAPRRNTTLYVSWIPYICHERSVKQVSRT